MKNYTWPELLDLFVKSRASAFSDLIEEPSLGENDEWLFVAVDNYINKLSTEEFFLLLKDIELKVKEKYVSHPVLGSIVFSVVTEMIRRRPTKYHLQKYPDNCVPLELDQSEEKVLIDYLLSFKDGIPEAHKYQVYALIEELTGKWLGKNDRYLP